MKKISKQILSFVLALLCVFSVFTMFPYQEVNAAENKVKIQWEAGKVLEKSGGSTKYVSCVYRVQKPYTPIQVSYNVSNLKAAGATKVVITVSTEYNGKTVDKHTRTITTKKDSLKGTVTFNLKYFNKSYSISIVAYNKNGKKVNQFVTDRTKKSYSNIKTMSFCSTDSNYFITDSYERDGNRFVEYIVYVPKKTSRKKLVTKNAVMTVTSLKNNERVDDSSKSCILYRKLNLKENGSIYGYTILRGVRQIDYNVNTPVRVTLSGIKYAGNEVKFRVKYRDYKV